MHDRTATISCERSAKPASEVLRRPGFSPSPRSAFPPAFTLVELMISIALVVILILGINSVFKYTAQAVGQGQAINTAVRDSRAAQTTMSNDFAALVPNGSGATNSASLIIASSATPAFMNAADKAASTLGDPMKLDINGNGTEGETTVPGEIVSPATYNSRNHRLDTLSFFARNSFHRQTGNDGTYVDDMSTQEAWIWYGHLWLPGNDQSTHANAFDTTTTPPKTYPGVGTAATNPNNVYASQFALGRVAKLLKLPSGGTVVDSNGVAQAYHLLDTSGGSPNAYYQSPLWFNCISTLNGVNSVNQTDMFGYNVAHAFLFQESRNDLAGTSIKTLQTQVANALAVPDYLWWVRSTYAITSNAYTATTPVIRFQANPFVNKPINAARLAAATPYFIPGCSQFTVEFAGDFLIQDNNPARPDDATHSLRASAPYTVYGDITGYGQDGQLDYRIANGSKQILWYGLPRNTSGAGQTSYLNGDVVPLNDWLQTTRDTTKNAVLATPPVSSFEKVGPTRATPNTDWTANGGTGMTALEAQRGYVCAFGPNDPSPSLIRITMTLNDAGGQLPDGQTYQFVFAVPPQ